MRADYANYYVQLLPSCLIIEKGHLINQHPHNIPVEALNAVCFTDNRLADVNSNALYNPFGLLYV